MANQPASTPRLITKIVIGYDLNTLPASLIRGLTLLRSKLARKRFVVEVMLRPLSQLPADTDVLLVPCELAEAGRQVAPPDVRLATLDIQRTRQPAFDELVEQLEAGQDIYALRVEEEASRSDPQRGVIVRYRGHERID